VRETVPASLMDCLECTGTLSRAEGLLGLPLGDSPSIGLALPDARVSCGKGTSSHGPCQTNEDVPVTDVLRHGGLLFGIHSLLRCHSRPALPTSTKRLALELGGRTRTCIPRSKNCTPKFPGLGPPDSGPTV
jgi:hypothetical protein